MTKDEREIKRKLKILPSTEMTEIVNPTREYEVANRSATTLKPCDQAFARLRHDLKLHWPSRLLLNYGCAVTDVPAADQIADLELDKVTAPQFAIYRQIEQGTIPKAMVFVTVEPDSPYVARFERTLWTNILACVPGAPIMDCGIKV